MAPRLTNKLSFEGKGLRYKLFIIEALIFILPFLALAYIFYTNRIFLEFSQLFISALILVLILAGLVMMRQIFDRFLAVSALIKKTVSDDEYLMDIQKDKDELHQITIYFADLMEKFQETTDELKRRVFELFAIKELTEVASKSLDINDLLNILLEKAMAVPRAQIGSVFMVETEEQRFRVVASKGLEPGPKKDSYINFHESLARLVVADREPLIVQDIEADPRTSKTNDPRYGAPSFLSMPVFVRDELVAVLNLSHKETKEVFDSNDQQILSIMIGEIAFALENAQLHTEVAEHLKALQERTAELTTTNEQLQQEITDRKRAEEALRKAQEGLERRVKERTAELANANEQLRGEIEERKHAQEQLEKSKTMLQEVFDGISDPLIMVDSDMAVKMLNRATAEYYDIAQPQDAIGKSCFEGFRGNGGPCEGCRVPFAVSTGDPMTFERKVTADPIRVEQVVIYPLQEEKAEMTGAIIRISDITGQKLMEKQLIQNEKLASLGLLVSGIAHEINNPNNFITFNIPILHDYLKEVIPIIDDYGHVHPDFHLFGMSYPEFREDLFRLLDNIGHGSSRINATVSGLREFVRKKDKVELRWADLREVIEKGVAICRGQVKNMVKSFEVDVTKEAPPVFTDPEALEQVLVNLVINAAQAADKEDSWVRLTVQLGDTQTDHVIIEVSDNGCGMDEQTREKIFRPFFTTKSTGSGTGLGLFVSHNLIEGLGGHIELQSEPGKGSTFRITLPDMGQHSN